MTAKAPSRPSAELEARIQSWINDYQPVGAIERDLIERAARLSWAIDRVDRCEAARAAQRVRAANLGNQAERAAEVAGLARKLLYMCGKRSVPGSSPAWDDDPPVFVAALEASIEGTRWMIQRWSEIVALVDSGAAWTFADQFKFIRLLGKRPVDAVDDPELNAIVLAWEAIEADWGVAFWTRTRDATPSDDPAFNAWRQWRALGAQPDNPAAGWLVIRSIVDRELSRLNQRLAVLEEAERADALDAADRAIIAADNASERLRRHRAVLSRELLRTLDAVAKLRKAQAPTKTAKQPPIEKANEIVNPRRAGGVSPLSGNQEPSEEQGIDAPHSPEETPPRKPATKATAASTRLKKSRVARSKVASLVNSS